MLKLLNNYLARKSNLLYPQEYLTSSRRVGQTEWQILKVVLPVWLFG